MAVVADLDITSRLDYVLDWAPKWMVSGDTIDTSAWVLPPQLNAPHPDGKSETKTVVWLEPVQGVAAVGESYLVVNNIVTTGNDAPESFPRHYNQTMTINIVDN